ncbi:hypothetical protein MSHOH_1969 [Methanosarcina horonobensis HB-1 = JCM 15518]|uniref:Fido domain-containing protein n=1 Tax=Methanosarcina horonobensis HB-1 = JCM 15518 TaxID=1434110 RepID=A0A0E3SE56_9EURY|nr:Fic family protein [Methanosarcina horonobensis]AKB78452.1 hypothetical protein MSHOH_1969 [Methanosarcina horonobensis HB-1 = JCM 15518]
MLESSGHSNVYIRGCPIEVGNAETLEEDLQRLIDGYYADIAAKKHPFECAVLFHQAFEALHPFTGGNK